MTRTRGVVTVYAGVVTMLILAVGLALLESAREYVEGTAVQRYADMAAEMTFSHYCRPLAERYDLYILEKGKDGTGLTSFDQYLAENLSENENNGGRFLSLYGQADSSSIVSEDISHDEFAPLFQQIRKYASYHMADTAVTRLTERVNQYKATGSVDSADEYAEMIRKEGQRTDEAQEAADESTENAGGQGSSENNSEDTGEQNDSTEKPENKPRDPRKGIGRWLRQGVLHLVMQDTPVSDKSVDLSACSFPVSGNMTAKTADEFEDYEEAEKELKEQAQQAEEGEMSISDDLLLDVYILDKFGNLTETKQREMDGGKVDFPAVLSYEQEFILFGQKTDEKNLTYTLMALQAMRTMLNLLYLRTDWQKRAEIADMALTIASAAAVPVAGFLIEMLLTLCWAGAESVMDLRCLVHGGKVPLLKTEDTWSLSLSDLCHIADTQAGGEETEGSRTGLTYSQYLSILLVMEPRRKKVPRMLDLMELNTRLEDGYSDFSFADGAVGARFSGVVHISPFFSLYRALYEESFCTEYFYVQGK